MNGSVTWYSSSRLLKNAHTWRASLSCEPASEIVSGVFFMAQWTASIGPQIHDGRMRHPSRRCLSYFGIDIPIPASAHVPQAWARWQIGGPAMRADSPEFRPCSTGPNRLRNRNPPPGRCLIPPGKNRRNSRPVPRGPYARAATAARRAISVGIRPSFRLLAPNRFQPLFTSLSPTKVSTIPSSNCVNAAHLFSFPRRDQFHRVAAETLKAPPAAIGRRNADGISKPVQSHHPFVGRP